MTRKEFELPYEHQQPNSQSQPPPISHTPATEPKTETEIEHDLCECADILREISSHIARVAPEERTFFYEVSDVISTNATAQTAVLSDDSNLYIRERVFDRLGFNAPTLNVYNDGPGTWFIRHSHDGHNFSEEYPIYEGEAKTYTNIYELRHRAPLSTLRYRVTEFPMWKQKNVDFKAGRGYIRNQTLAVGNVAPLVAYTTADTHSINATIQRNATTGYVKNLDNTAILFVWVSEDGTEYGQSGLGLGVEYITVQPLSVFHIDGWSLNSVRVGADINNVNYEVVGG